jgi:hypothetical protein
MRIRLLLVACLLVALGLLLPRAGLAEVMGHFSQAEGRVEVLHGGKLPATPVKLQDGVQPGDVIRTKSLSKAQITFKDNTVLTISPESRITIEEYMYDPAKGKRNAVLQMFQGLALFVVSKVYQTEQPDFVVKTHTAIMGIRGTEVGIRLQPNESTFLTFSGLIRVSSNFAEIPGFVDAKAGQGITARGGLPPTLPFEITAEDRQLFMRQLATGIMSRRGGGDKQGADSRSGGLPALTEGNVGPGGVSITPRLKPDTQVAQASLPAPPPPPPPPPPPAQGTYSVNLSGTGIYCMSFGPGPAFGEGHKGATYSGTIALTNNITQTSVGNITFAIQALDPVEPGNFAQSSSGQITSWIMTGTLTPNSSGTYTGTVTASGLTSGGTSFNFSFTATYDGTNLTFTPVSGTYTLPTNPKDYPNPDFVNPGGSNKPTAGTANLVNWSMSTAPSQPVQTAAPTPSSSGTEASPAGTLRTYGSEKGGQRGLANNPTTMTLTLPSPASLTPTAIAPASLTPGAPLTSVTVTPGPAAESAVTAASLPPVPSLPASASPTAILSLQKGVGEPPKNFHALEPHGK